MSTMKEESSFMKAVKMEDKKQRKNIAKPVEYEPPDGGYGWVIVLGASIVMVSTRSAEPSFGLLFGDFLRDLGVETTGAAVIMNTMDATMNFSGLLVAPLIRTYSYRKVSMIGSILCTLSILLTVPAKSFIHILLTFSIIGGIGAGLAISATFVAINTFFTRRKGMAVGFSMAGTGIGLLLMPTTIRLLLDNLGFQTSILCLAAFTMHSIVGSCLLRPIKWYRKVKKDVEIESGDEMTCSKGMEDNHKQQQVEDGRITIPPSVAMTNSEGRSENKGMERKPLFQIGEHKFQSTTIVVEEVDMLRGDMNPKRNLIPRNFSVDAMHEVPWKSILGKARSHHGGVSCTSGGGENNSVLKGLLQTEEDEIRLRRNESIVASSVDLSGSTFHIPGSLLALDVGEMGRKKSDCRSILHIEQDKEGAILEREEEEDDDSVSIHQEIPLDKDRMESEEEGCLSKIVRLMDLDLLRDPVFLNILIGMSFFWVAEVNYRMIMPFFLTDLSYSHSETATVLTAIAAADILSRIIVPPIIDRINVKRRNVFFITSILLAIARSAMAEMTSWSPLLFFAVVGGFLRGTTLINFQLTIAESSSLDKLPAAYGLSMVFKGIFIVSIGPLIGVVRDSTGSFPVCLHFQTLLIVVCFLAWSAEFIGSWFKRRNGQTAG